MRGGTVADRVRTYTLVRALNLQILGATAGNRRDFEKDKTERGGPPEWPTPSNGRGWVVSASNGAGVRQDLLPE